MYLRFTTLTLCLVFLGVDASITCSAPPHATNAELANLTKRNCLRVKRSSHEIPEIVKHSSMENQQAWKRRLAKATSMCVDAQNEDNPKKAVGIALTAWGDVLMQGLECCDRVVPPFCYGVVPSPVQRYAPFAIVVIACVVFLLSPLCCNQLTAPNLVRLPTKPRSRLGSFATQAERQAGSRAKPDGQTGTANHWHDLTYQSVAEPLSSQTLRRDLQTAWAGVEAKRQPGAASQNQASKGKRQPGSPLRLLAGAPNWGQAAVDICTYLFQAFGFQQDNVRNQFEHLLSLWRSQVAMVGDQSTAAQMGYNGCTAIDEASFLPEAVKQLHGTLLEGFGQWRKKFVECEEVGQLSRLPSKTQLAGMPQSNCSENQELQTLFPKLAEIIVFLLVWGEAGNLRFMPELLYFISDLILAAENPAMFTMPVARGDNISCPFLVQVIRPIYNVIFDETYRCVEVDVPSVEVQWKSLGHSERLLMVKTVNVTRSDDRIQTELMFDKRQSQNEKQQQWHFHQVGFRDSGEREKLYQIRWAADKTLCLHVDHPTSGERRLTLQEVRSGVEAQQFCVNTTTNRIAWKSSSATYYISSTRSSQHSSSRSAVLVQQCEVNQSLQFCLIDGKSGKETKKLHPGFEAFLPPDTANYDDWNELFCDPARMVQSLVLHDGSRFFNIPHSRRLEALASVDWRSSLKNVKTQREVHSWWGVFASTQRIWLLHALAFLVLVCWCSTRGNSPYDIAGDMPKEGRTVMLSFAAAGLVVPFHAACWAFASWCTSGYAKRKYLFRCRPHLLVSVMLGLLWIAPLITYFLARSLEPSSGSSKFIAVVVVHFAFCILGAFMLVVAPGWPQEGGPSLTKVSLCIGFGRSVFWTLAFGAKITLSMVIISAFSQAATDLVLCPISRESVFIVFQGGAANLILDESMLSSSQPAYWFLPPRPPRSALPVNDLISENSDSLTSQTLGPPPSRPTTGVPEPDRIESAQAQSLGPPPARPPPAFS